MNRFKNPLLALWTSLLAIAPLTACSQTESGAEYELKFHAEFSADEARAIASIAVVQRSAILKQLDFNAPPERYSLLSHEGQMTRDGDRLRWTPPAGSGVMRYEFQIDQARGDAFDARHAKDWAILRLDDLFPPAKARVTTNASASGVVSLAGPPSWSFESRYGSLNAKAKTLPQEGRFYTRPTGWLAAGELGTRRESIAGREIILTAPRGGGFKRMDTLAYLRWTLPTLIEALPRFPDRLLIVGAPEEMWRGGLSAPGSLYVHVARPLISENGTSTLLHELVHTAGVHSAEPGADWIVEGLAEFYGLAILNRAGGLSNERYAQSLESLAAWVKERDGRLSDPSSGSDTAKAVLVLAALDEELTRSRHSMDEVTAHLIDNGFSSSNLRSITTALLGVPSQVLIQALD